MSLWFAHPKSLPNRTDQIAWRRAVEEVATCCGDEKPTGKRSNQSLPGGNVFCCVDCSNPTYESLCCLCEGARPHRR